MRSHPILDLHRSHYPCVCRDYYDIAPSVITWGSENNHLHFLSTHNTNYCNPTRLPINESKYKFNNHLLSSTEALDCLWILSFDDSNKPKIMAEPGLVQAVCDKYRAGSGRAGHTCHGILWSLREHLQASPDFQDIGKF